MSESEETTGTCLGLDGFDASIPSGPAVIEELLYIVNPIWQLPYIHSIDDNGISIVLRGVSNIQICREFED